MEDATKCADSNCHRKQSEVKKSGSKIPPSSALKQQSLYSKADKPIPDNSPFYTERSNPLSSKGN
ncbi:MAG: hypothetical protein HFI81_02405 [Eubacterium sp.]|nr:hypothetical protein [Eubacterium sp.]